MKLKAFTTYRRRNIRKYVLNRLCGVHRLLKRKPPIFQYIILYVWLTFQFIMLKKIYIPQVEIVITTRCNLRCKDCSNYIPSIENEYQFDISFDEYKQNLDNLLINAKKLNSVLLIGGEPLLNKEIIKILDYTAQNKKVESVYIITNGTILLSDELIKTLEKYRKKTYVWLSNYTSNTDLVKRLKTNEILQQLTENKINYIFFKKNKWVKPSPIKCYNRTREELTSVFTNCGNPAVSAAKGEVHICPRAATFRIRDLIQFSNNDFINMNRPVSKKDIISFYSKNDFEICNYCRGLSNNPELITPAIQIKEGEE